MDSRATPRIINATSAKRAAMTEDRLTDELVRRVMGWRVAPDRFIKSGRKWMPRWRFAPLTSLEHAFDLVDRAASTYTISRNKVGTFEADVRVGRRIGKASGNPKARTITIALARALGLTLPDEGTDQAPVPQGRRTLRPRSKVDGI